MVFKLHVCMKGCMHVLVCVHSVYEGMCTHTPILYLLVCTHLISHCGFHKLSIIIYIICTESLCKCVCIVETIEYCT